MSGPILEADGSLYVEENGVPVAWVAGRGISDDNRLCVTNNLNADDVFLAGLRLDQLGRIVCGNGVAAARPYVYVSGLPTDKRDGRLIRQYNQTPAPSDPFVAGVRVGPLGGVYMNVDVPLPPENVVAPAVTGTPSPFNTLTCSTGSWDGEINSMSFQWQQDTVDIPGANQSTLYVTEDRVGGVIRCFALATNNAGTTSAMSNEVTIVP